MDWLKILSGLGLLSISGLWVALSLHLPFPSFARASKVGPAHFPILVASLLALLTIIWLVRESRKSPNEREVRGIHLIPWYFGYAGYLVVVPFLGFIPATFLLVVAVVGFKTRGPWAMRLSKSFLAGIIITGLEWGVFQKWLGVPLPTGILGLWGR
ncbi:MAG: tripartite tricarboxylate transporter TctB family protein [Candidatus Bipolaricaulota bacterium]|nr:tripartite tricarboxylate transporter TctB family protein [Candidatus Bipolaricaulota bacterium]MDW8126411.1 tripartite tricarboxylate transporter TctB family protein [Candidatus Bipolaricaulota bacterium]